MVKESTERFIKRRNEQEIRGKTGYGPPPKDASLKDKMRYGDYVNQ